MDSHLTDSIEEWRAQMAAMRQALAQFKLPDSASLAAKDTDEDLDLDAEISDEPYDDIWDVDSTDNESPDTGDLETRPNGYHTPEVIDGVFDRRWLTGKCSTFTQGKTGMSATDLEQQIVALLASDSSNDELQMSLAEVIGYEDLDFVIELISHRSTVLKEPKSGAAQTDGLFAGLETRAQREARLKQQDYVHKHAALAPAHDRTGPVYPHVFKSDNAAAGNLLSLSGQRFALPVGSERIEQPRYEEYAIPATKVGTQAAHQKLVAISEMDNLCKRTFTGYDSLNRMQSLLYPVAYRTSENMLVCAPTGAGKTDAALLTILNTISHNIEPNPLEHPEVEDFVVRANDFKIVYVAPMKALAAEVTEKYGKKLAWLGIRVRELTGDMQLTKREISETQIIVTTPEKWDVVTRKSTGDTELVQKVQLLLLDEVHLVSADKGLLH